MNNFINYASVAWGTTCMANLKKLSSQQKHVMRIICNKGKFEHTKRRIITKESPGYSSTETGIGWY